MTNVDQLIRDLPDPESARRFFTSLEEAHPAEARKLQKNSGLMSDVLTLAAYSPLLSTTILQNPDYLSWLGRERTRAGVRSKDELLESLARFGMTHSQVDLHTQLARFRRRELLRIFLSDVRRLTTIAETTEDISNLADAILETALRDARQEMDNRFGQPQVIDDKGKKITAEFCVVSLGKLGSRELNYASDIDLMFLYSADGETSGQGSRGVVTNREYFVKLGEAITQIVGKQKGEGAAYRVDMRLRPHGRVAPLSISVADAVRYYRGEARDWERQVLIRSRSCAGDAAVYKNFFDQVEASVFLHDASVESSLESVRRSKQLIDRELKSERGFNVKLGSGGIREIEFIAQALQLAYGGDDAWLRASHTLISLSRLADRHLITEPELTDLFSSYEFLRHAEHVLQMENGLQMHTIPDDPHRRLLVAKRMGYENVADFNAGIRERTGSVERIFERVFRNRDTEPQAATDSRDAGDASGLLTPDPALSAITGRAAVSHPTRELYTSDLSAALLEPDFRHQLGSFRRQWSELQQSIRESELRGDIDIRGAKRAQTALAEASIDIALEITRNELADRYEIELDDLPLAVMGLGKLGGGAIDYESDLDLVLVYDDASPVAASASLPEFYSRAAEIFVTTLSSMTRDGSIYRVDLRLRPYGNNGTSTIAGSVFVEYMRSSADIWEWLAYVKLRAVAGDMELAEAVEKTIREIIHARASETDAAELSLATRDMRMRLELEKTRRRRTSEVDIKYGSGGMLDIYFTMRYLQLRDNVPDRSGDRSTDFMLRVLHDAGSLDEPTYKKLLEGYTFLSTLDHYLRLIVGRTTRLPAGKPQALDTIAERMGLKDHTEMIERLTIQRLTVRNAFDEILSPASAS